MRESISSVLSYQDQFSASITEPMRLRKVALLDDLLPQIETVVRQSGGGAALEVNGSNGVGNAARVPWIRIFNSEQSPSPTQGWYIVFLFAADGSAVSLSLNQGVTQLSTAEIERNVGAARHAIAHSALLNDGERSSRAVTSIHLADPGLGRKYELGNILAFEYEASAIPDDETISADLEWLVDRLRVLPNEPEAAVPIWESPDIESLDPDEAALKILCDSIHWPAEKVMELFEGLIDESPQIILTGPPGTGKTFVAQHLAAYLLNTPGQIKNNPYVEVVQFHPSYGYEDFVEGLRPAPAEGGLLEFVPVPGTILRMADAIVEDGMPRVLIIDEMNRANLPKVFGELMFLLEYRDQDIRLVHRERFSLPSNLYIIGTMNTADRSITSIDLALRRRFDFFELSPSLDVLRSHYNLPGHTNSLGESLFNGVALLNSELQALLGDRHHQIGHSYFLKARMDQRSLQRVWTQQLFPLIEDFFFDRPHLAEEFTMVKFWPNVAV